MGLPEIKRPRLGPSGAVSHYLEDVVDPSNNAEIIPRRSDNFHNGAREGAPLAAEPWTTCQRCGWAGAPHDFRVVEHWTSGRPGYWQIRPTCPSCGARVPRR